MLTVRMQHKETTVAQLPEEIDYDNAALVGAQGEDLVRQGCRTLVLDASLVQYLDSSAITMFLALMRKLGDRAGTLRLAALNAHYEQTLHILGLQTLLPVFPTVSAALQPTATHQGAGNTESFGLT